MKATNNIPLVVIVSDSVAFVQNGREVTYAEVTTEDLVISASRYDCLKSKLELKRRGIKWFDWRE